MDPLSISASIIAVIGTIRTVSQGLERLASLRHAPDQLLALTNEVSTLHLS